MTITYKWDHILVSVLDGGIIEPHYSKEYRDVIYDYDVEPTVDDIVKYITPNGNSEDFNRGVKHAVLELIDYLDLENDEYFVEFIKNKYEDDARAEFEDSQY